MARTGLRMMPTFPSSPLKSRTVSFPQYGLKASISDGTFLNRQAFKSAPDILAQPRSLSPAFALVGSHSLSGSESRTAYRSASAAAPQGPLAPVRVVLSRSIIAYYDPMRQPRRHAATSLSLIRSTFAVRERLSSPRGLPYFHCRACHACHRPYPGGPPCPPVVRAR